MTTIKDWLLDIIGPYNTDYTAANFGQIDYVWICSAILLIALVITFFKALRFVLGGLKK